jgi:proteasome activator subunit 4
MKGALYVLRYNGVGIGRIARDWRQIVQLTECLLNAHHENKASVQALVTKATEELISGMKQPVSHLVDVQVDKVDAAVEALTGAIRYKPSAELVQRLNQGVRGVIEEQDREYDIFVDRVIAISQKPQLNWRYQLQASRFLFNVIRRDRPTDERFVKYFTGGILNPHPKIRDYGIL